MDAKLVMFKSNGQRKDFSLARATTVIGRAEDCGLRIPLPNVSRRHCEIAVSGDTIKVKDLGSANGTYVNNERVDEAELSAGDRVLIGSVVFTLQVDGLPEQIPSVKAPPPTVAAAEGVPAEEVVELEPDVSELPAEAGEPAEDIVAALEVDSGAEEEDPISALEALAAESQKNEEEDKSKKK